MDDADRTWFHDSIEKYHNSHNHQEAISLAPISRAVAVAHALESLRDDGTSTGAHASTALAAAILHAASTDNIRTISCALNGDALTPARVALFGVTSALDASFNAYTAPSLLPTLNLEVGSWSTRVTSASTTLLPVVGNSCGLPFVAGVVDGTSHHVGVSIDTCASRFLCGLQDAVSVCVCARAP